MIVREFYETRSDGVNLYKTYSDAGMMIRQDDGDVLYSEAIDVEIAHHTYTETDIPIETSDIEEEVAPSGPYLPPQQALDIVFGEVEE